MTFFVVAKLVSKDDVAINRLTVFDWTVPAEYVLIWIHSCHQF
jgi:hypothetical protein